MVKKVIKPKFIKQKQKQTQVVNINLGTKTATKGSNPKGVKKHQLLQLQILIINQFLKHLILLVWQM